MTDTRGSYNGLTFGIDGDVHVGEIDGLKGFPAPRESDQPRAQDHGEFRGSRFLPARRFTIQFHLITTSAAAYDALETDFKDAFVPDDDEKPLLCCGNTRLVNCSVMRYNLPDLNASIKRSNTALVEFKATDPRVYGATEEEETVNLPTASGGMTFPATFNLSFGAVSAGGSFVATNDGNAPTRPVFVITGPVDNPRIENVTAGKTLSFSISLATGESLVIDTDAHSVLLNGTASRRSTLTGQWWELNPGDSTIRYQANTYSAGSTLQATWRSAWWNT